jgi:hypothetical protein
MIPAASYPESLQCNPTNRRSTTSGFFWSLKPIRPVCRTLIYGDRFTVLLALTRQTSCIETRYDNAKEKSSIPPMSSDHLQTPSAGSAEPYWFEWETGLLSLVEMLDEDSDIVSVGFQLHGTKGWDDVGVRLRDGTTRLMQIKHSRVDNTFTFGDLVNGQGGEASLLRTLASAWKTERQNRGRVECLLRTNRRPGPNWHLESPPLTLFFEKLDAAVTGLVSITDIQWDGEDERLPQAWLRFLREIDMLEPAERLDFIRAFRMEASAPDLDQLEALLKERLAILSGLSPSAVHPLFNALLANLSKWASHSRRESEWIDRESLRSFLAGSESSPRWLGHCEVETPNPFFPSRQDVVEVLKTALTDLSTGKIHFLSADPGAGKTSCISRLSRSGSVFWKDQCISIRFYAYRPIRPGEPDIGNDFGEGVRPEALWLGLLWQIRDNLRRSQLLATLSVPVWLDGMSWEVARGHVLRIAELLGISWDRPFVICIDGLDHAARARRAHLPEFLRTLPSPDAVPTHVRFLIGGQPADSFPEYPFFLRQDHPQVVRHSIETLADEDLRVLWQSISHRLPPAYDDGAVRLLEHYAQRKTLPTVYAAEDIRECATLADAESLLASRPLPDSLGNYYDVIWTSASNTEGDMSRLAAAFSMLRERPTGALMASAFSDLGRSAIEWNDVMRKLRPLVRETPQGFELVHNDLRVHLSAGLATQAFALGDAASALADHYRRSTNRHAAHTTLPDLLVTAGRRHDFADDFTTEWVVEAGELGLDDDRLAAQCSMAFEGAVHRKDWLLLHAVACASLTVNRLHECTMKWPTEEDPLSSSQAPLFLAFEGETRPLELWNSGSFPELVSSAEQLLQSGATTRAAAVLKQWIGDINAEQLVDGLLATLQQQENDHHDKPFCPDLEKFGRLCALCDIPIPQMNRESDRQMDQLEAIELGWVRGNAEISNRSKALRSWLIVWPMFNSSWFTALDEAARRSRWGEVRALLNRMNGCLDEVGPVKRMEFAWHATRARAKNLETWQAAMGLPDYGLVQRCASLATLCTIASCVTYNNVIREFSQVAEELIPLLDVHDLNPRKRAAILLILRTSGIIGRMLRYVDRNDLDGVRTAVPPLLLERYLEALWCKEPDWRNLPDNEINTPSKVAESLAKIARGCGDVYQSPLVRIAKERFPGVILRQEGSTAFAVLREAGEEEFLKHSVTNCAQELILRLHEHDAPSRNGIAGSLLSFTSTLGLHDLNLELAGRLKRTRMGYGCHKEWVFQPLIRWFEVLRKSEPGLWRSHGFQLLVLDEIAGLQGADNRFDSELMTEVGTAAIACGPDHFETLFKYLADSTSKYPLANLKTVAREGLVSALAEKIPLEEDAILSLIALAIALGRWPNDSATTTVGYLMEQPAAIENGHAGVLKRAAVIAALIQGATAPEPPAPPPAQALDRIAPRAALTRLADGISGPIASDLRLADIAALVEKANVENTPHRDTLVANALEALEGANALNRCLDFHEIRTISKFTENLKEDELWRMLAAITSLTGDLRAELDIDPMWAFNVAFSAVDLTCRSLVEKGADIGLPAFEQLLETHWKWHGLSSRATGMSVPDIGSSWQDVVRRSLFALMQTDACETLYMAMAGTRFFTEAFPAEIPAICREGLADDRAKDAVVALAQLWATRCPETLHSSVSTFANLESDGTLDERLDAWLVTALRNRIIGAPVDEFSIPEQVVAPEISFPGDTKLLEIPSERNGLVSHSAFPDMANKRLRRAALVIGSSEVAFRKMARTVKESPAGSPSFYLGAPKKLAWDNSYPRPSRYLGELVGDAIIYQCSGQSWSSGNAAATRLVMGSNMDPWIASAPPNQWLDKDAWPSDYDVEKWFESGADDGSEVGSKLAALRDGADLDPALIQLGAVVHVPTFRRDISFFQWLVPTQGGRVEAINKLSTIPYGKTSANWLGGWSHFAGGAASSVHFAGSLVSYPMAELEVTPTDYWELFWNWLPDPGNPLQFLSKNGTPVSRHERWHCSNGYSKKVTRLPSLYRWVARRDSFPPQFDGLSGWKSKTKMDSWPLLSPE